jgi:RNA polymerase sigma factor FliA
MNTSRTASLDATDHLGLVYKLAAQIHRVLRGRAEFDELVSYGVEGLLRARDRFDPAFGCSFGTFAHYRIRGAIWDGVRASCPLPGRQYRRDRTGDAGERAFVGSLEEVPPSALCDDAPGVDDQLDVRCHARLLSAALGRLPERERSLLHRHYWDDDNLLDAGAKIGVTKSGASRMHARALGRLRQDMRTGGRARALA